MPATYALSERDVEQVGVFSFVHRVELPLCPLICTRRALIGGFTEISEGAA